MIFGWLRERRRKKLLARPFPSRWETVLEGLPFFARLDAGERARTREVVAVLAAEKSWEGCGGLKLTDRMVVAIGAQAAVPILHIPHDYYAAVDSILVYPSAFVDPRERMDEDGIVTAGEELAGQAHAHGPVVLAWDEARDGIAGEDDGRNLVIHEFAHRLDMADGYADGIPLVGGSESIDAWAALMRREREKLERDSRAGKRTVLDPYGAEDPAELFAVAAEAFFERPRELREDRPNLYAALREFFQQDPAVRQD